jgi:hypothetical protein
MCSKSAAKFRARVVELITGGVTAVQRKEPATFPFV